MPLCDRRPIEDERLRFSRLCLHCPHGLLVPVDEPRHRGSVHDLLFARLSLELSALGTSMDHLF